MGTEAQKLITVSLEKIASCRRRRREMSLHKNLLVTTVIHKARIAIMEETYYMMSYAAATNATCGAAAAKATDGARTTTAVLPVYCHNGSPSTHYSNTGGQEPMYYDDRTVSYGNPLSPTTSSVSSSTSDYSYQQSQQLPIFSASVAVADFGSREAASEVMEWEGMDGSTVGPAVVRTGATTVVGGGEEDEEGDEGDDEDEDGADSDVDEDKENVSPLDYTTVSPSARRAHRLALRQSRCKKRSRLTNDDEPTERKRMRWDPLYVAGTEAGLLDDPCCGVEGSVPSRVVPEDTITANTTTISGFDPHDDMSTALRFVSVLSASLGGGGSGMSLQQAVAAPPLPPVSSCQAMRLGRSLSTPELCSKQAKDSLEMIGSRTPVLAIAV